MSESETPETTTRKMTDANQLAGALLAATNDHAVKDKLLVDVMSTHAIVRFMNGSTFLIK